MSLFSDNDLTGMISTFKLDVEIVAKVGTDKQFSFPAIFDNSFKRYGDDMSELSGTYPFITAKSLNVVNLLQGDDLTVNGVAYQVRELQPNGYGLTAIELVKP